MSQWIRDWMPIIGILIAIMTPVVGAAIRRWGWPRPQFWLVLAASMVLVIDVGYVLLRPPPADIRVTVYVDNTRLTYRSVGGGSGQFGIGGHRGFCGQVEVSPGAFQFRLLIGDSPYSHDWLTVVVFDPVHYRAFTDGLQGSTNEFTVKVSGRRDERSFMGDDLDGSFDIGPALLTGILTLHWTPTDELIVEFECDNPSFIGAAATA